MASTITTDSGLKFTLLSFRSGNQFAIDSKSYDVELIESPGVDGSRLRLNRQEYRQYEAETIEEIGTYAIAAAAKFREYLAAKGALAEVVAEWAGAASFTSQEVFVLDVEPELRSGQVCGGGATGTATYHIRCKWTLKNASDPKPPTAS